MIIEHCIFIDEI